MRAVLLCSVLLAGHAAACDLKVDNAWIRTPAPGTTALAGYATLTNTGTQPLRLSSMQSVLFAAVEAHETLTENGVAKMRALKAVEIAPSASLEFVPGGRHFMLMSPKQAVSRGDVIGVTLRDATGCDTAVSFKVSDMAPAGATKGDASKSMDHSKMDHSKMDHSKMDH